MFWYFLISFFVNPTTLSQVAGYAPDEFRLNAKTRLAQTVWNATYPAVIEQISDEAMHMDSNTIAVIVAPACTQYRFECTPVFSAERTMEIQFRTTRTDFRRDPRHGITVILSESGMRVEEDGRLVMVCDSVKLSSKESQTIVLSTFASDYSIRIGCGPLFLGHSTLANCDALVLRSPAHSPMKVHAIVRNNAFSDLQMQ